MWYNSLMASNPIQAAMAALEWAMDNVPLTAEQRQHMRAEFGLRIGVDTTQQVNMPVSMPAATPSAPSPVEMNTPLVQQFTSLPFGAVPAVAQAPAVQLNLPLTAVVKDAAPSAASIHLPDVEVKKEGLLDWRPPGGPDPKKQVTTEMDVNARVASILQQKRAERKRVGFVRGIFDSMFIGVVIGMLVMGVGLGLSSAPALLIIYGVQTLALVAIIVVICYFLGSIHEQLWGGQRAYGIMLTIVRGVVSPVGIPLGIFFRLHQLLWGYAYGIDWKGKILRGIIGPVSIPAGLAWDISGWIMRLLGVRSHA